MELSEYFTVGNIFLALVFLLILNQLIELYQFRNMPPGPRLTSLPFIGNLLSFDNTAPGDSFLDSTARFVYIICSILLMRSQTVLSIRFGSHLRVFLACGRFKVVGWRNAERVATKKPEKTKRVVCGRGTVVESGSGRGGLDPESRGNFS